VNVSDKQGEDKLNPRNLHGEVHRTTSVHNLHFNIHFRGTLIRLRTHSHAY